MAATSMAQQDSRSSATLATALFAATLFAAALFASALAALLALAAAALLALATAAAALLLFLVALTLVTIWHGHLLGLEQRLVMVLMVVMDGPFARAQDTARVARHD